MFFEIRARVIASVEPGIEDRVLEGSFRRDLYHRLKVLTLTVPPLRDRASQVGHEDGHGHRRAEPEHRADEVAARVADDHRRVDRRAGRTAALVLADEALE